jgi:hypothetical protein
VQLQIHRFFLRVAKLPLPVKRTPNKPKFF